MRPRVALAVAFLAAFPVPGFECRLEVRTVDATDEMYERRRKPTRGPVSHVARFDANDLGHMDLYGRALEDVQECSIR